MKNVNKMFIVFIAIISLSSSSANIIVSSDDPNLQTSSKLDLGSLPYQFQGSTILKIKAEDEPVIYQEVDWQIPEYEPALYENESQASYTEDFWAQFLISEDWSNLDELFQVFQEGRADEYSDDEDEVEPYLYLVDVKNPFIKININNPYPGVNLSISDYFLPSYIIRNKTYNDQTWIGNPIGKINWVGERDGYIVVSNDGGSTLYNLTFGMLWGLRDSSDMHRQISLPIKLNIDINLSYDFEADSDITSQIVSGLIQFYSEENGTKRDVDTSTDQDIIVDEPGLNYFDTKLHYTLKTTPIPLILGETFIWGEAEINDFIDDTYWINTFCPGFVFDKDLHGKNSTTLFFRLDFSDYNYNTPNRIGYEDIIPLIQDLYMEYTIMNGSNSKYGYFGLNYNYNFNYFENIILISDLGVSNPKSITFNITVETIYGDTFSSDNVELIILERGNYDGNSLLKLGSNNLYNEIVDVGDIYYGSSKTVNFQLEDLYIHPADRFSSKVKFIEVDPTTGYLYALTWHGLFRSKDYGNRWELINDVYKAEDVNAMEISPAGDVFIAVNDGKYYLRLNSDNTWPSNMYWGHINDLEGTNITAYAFSPWYDGINDDLIFFGTENGRIFNGTNSSGIDQCITEHEDDFGMGSKTISSISSEWPITVIETAILNYTTGRYTIAAGTQSAGFYWANNGTNTLDYSHFFNMTIDWRNVGRFTDDINLLSNISKSDLSGIAPWDTQSYDRTHLGGWIKTRLLDHGYNTYNISKVYSSSEKHVDIIDSGFLYNDTINWENCLDKTGVFPEVFLYLQFPSDIFSNNGDIEEHLKNTLNNRNTSYPHQVEKVYIENEDINQVDVIEDLWEEFLEWLPEWALGKEDFDFWKINKIKVEYKTFNISALNVECFNFNYTWDPGNTVSHLATWNLTINYKNVGDYTPDYPNNFTNVSSSIDGDTIKIWLEENGFPYNIQKVYGGNWIDQAEYDGKGGGDEIIAYRVECNNTYDLDYLVWHNQIYIDPTYGDIGMRVPSWITDIEFSPNYSNDGQIYIGTRSDGLLSQGVYQTTCGAPWGNAILNTTPIDDPLNNYTTSLTILGDYLYVGTSNGGIYRGDSNGNWKNVGDFNWFGNNLYNQKINDIEVNNSNLYVATEGGGIFRNTTNGWTVNNSGLEEINWSLYMQNKNKLASGLYECVSDEDYINGYLPILEGSSDYRYEYKVKDWNVALIDGQYVGNLTLEMFNWRKETIMNAFSELRIRWGFNEKDTSFGSTALISLDLNAIYPDVSQTEIFADRNTIDDSSDLEINLDFSKKLKDSGKINAVYLGYGHATTNLTYVKIDDSYNSNIFSGGSNYNYSIDKSILPRGYSVFLGLVEWEYNGSYKNITFIPSYYSGLDYPQYVEDDFTYKPKIYFLRPPSYEIVSDEIYFSPRASVDVYNSKLENVTVEYCVVNYSNHSQIISDDIYKDKMYFKDMVDTLNLVDGDPLWDFAKSLGNYYWNSSSFEFKGSYEWNLLSVKVYAIDKDRTRPTDKTYSKPYKFFVLITDDDQEPPEMSEISYTSQVGKIVDKEKDINIEISISASNDNPDSGEEFKIYVSVTNHNSRKFTSVYEYIVNLSALDENVDVEFSHFSSGKKYTLGPSESRIETWIVTAHSVGLKSFGFHLRKSEAYHYFENNFNIEVGNDPLYDVSDLKVRAKIVDESNISSAIIRYKSNKYTNWQEISMDYQGDDYYSIVIPREISEQIEFKIVAWDNDSKIQRDQAYSWSDIMACEGYDYMPPTILDVNYMQNQSTKNTLKIAAYVVDPGSGVKEVKIHFKVYFKENTDGFEIYESRNMKQSSFDPNYWQYSLTTNRPLVDFVISAIDNEGNSIMTNQSKSYNKIFNMAMFDATPRYKKEAIDYIFFSPIIPNNITPGKMMRSHVKAYGDIQGVRLYFRGETMETYILMPYNGTYASINWKVPVCLDPGRYNISMFLLAENEYIALNGSKAIYVDETDQNYILSTNIVEIEKISKNTYKAYVNVSYTNGVEFDTELGGAVYVKVNGILYSAEYDSESGLWVATFSPDNENFVVNAYVSDQDGRAAVSSRSADFTESSHTLEYILISVLIGSTSVFGIVMYKYHKKKEDQLISQMMEIERKATEDEVTQVLHEHLFDDM